MPTPRNFFESIRAMPGQKSIDRYIMTHEWAYKVGYAIAVVSSFWIGGYGGAVYQAYYTYIATGSATQAVTVGIIAAGQQYVGNYMSTGSGFSMPTESGMLGAAPNASSVSTGPNVMGMFMRAFSRAPPMPVAERSIPTSNGFRLFLVSEHTNPDSNTGHLFIGGMTPDGKVEAYGFYPDEHDRNALFAGRQLHGLVRNDTALFKRALSGDRYFRYRTYDVDEDAYRRAMAYIVSYDRHYDYSLYSNSCVHAAMRTLHHVGLVNGIGNALPGVHPNKIFDLLPAQ